MIFKSFALSALAVLFAVAPAQAGPDSHDKFHRDVIPRHRLAEARHEIVARDAISSICTQNDIITTTSFILFNNLWGEDQATSGSQCTYLDAEGDGWIAWQTAWTWASGSTSVKSYANAVLNIGARQLSTISSIPTTWNWSYSGTDIVADVSYDIMLSTEDSTTASHSYEIMIWLASFSAEPIGYSSGPIAYPSIGGITWTLYQGTNDWDVFSFVAPETIENFSGDVNDFFTYLIDYQGVSSSNYLQTVGAGTEPFDGTDAWFTTTLYTASLS
ncbi:concanavalin A-like lectin/glucanase [Penicillium taxi]|uniref:concanavalin A-like lectin/glucanase n=1 Tax=Penicillium taxi TaxID=168475 RepID=UPI0025457D73|nr:concanavalin A-like lectin/glucanase [Penicillium taxi]KAJ5894724.1 concanavalin A-like lectin/glucanase [Penicillium taxi]